MIVKRHPGLALGIFFDRGNEWKHSCGHTDGEPTQVTIYFLCWEFFFCTGRALKFTNRKDKCDDCGLPNWGLD